MYVHCNVRRDCKKMENHDYDAYILYVESDYNKYIAPFKRKLEQCSNQPLKLCIQDRDFNVGRPLQDNIIDAVERSS